MCEWQSATSSFVIHALLPVHSVSAASSAFLFASAVKHKAPATPFSATTTGLNMTTDITPTVHSPESQKLLFAWFFSRLRPSNPPETSTFYTLSPRIKGWGLGMDRLPWKLTPTIPSLSWCAGNELDCCKTKTISEQSIWLTVNFSGGLCFFVGLTLNQRYVWEQNMWVNCLNIYLFQ